jgi:hypothetical protein
VVPLEAVLAVGGLLLRRDAFGLLARRERREDVRVAGRRLERVTTTTPNRPFGISR